MQTNSMENDAIIVELSLAEQYPHVDNQQGENSTQNQSNSEEIAKVMNKVKTSPMTPTPLEYSCWSTHPTATAVGAFGLFTSLSMIVGVLVVCLTSPKTGLICSPMLNPTVPYSSRDTSHPQSVAVGDFNNDNQMDIVVANFGTDNVGVFLGYGNDSFASQMMYSTGPGSAPSMVAVGDFNKDNRLDIAVANFGTNNIGIHLSNGDGTFKSQTIIQTTPSRPLYVVISDFNNDKQLDIAFVGYGTNSIGVLLGFGNGNFRTQTTFPTGYDALPYSIALGDLNNDNKLDIAVANYGTDNVGVLLGYGNGTFVIQTIYSTGANSHPYSIAICDLNNDTYLDIAVVISGANKLGVLFGHGNGVFTLPTFYSTGNNSNPIFIAIADFNNDNKPDIAVANNGTDSAGVLLGYGNGTFANQITYSTGPGSSPYSIAIADFNNDKRLDIAIANQQTNNVMIFNGYINYTFASQINYPTGDGSYPLWAAVGDFNNDSRLDIAVANSGTNNVGILLGHGDGTFANEMTYSTGDSSKPQAIVLGDFNNDSRSDIAVANSGADNVGILLGYGNGTFASQTTYSTGYSSNPVAVVVGDFNNDSRSDIAVVNSGTNSVSVLLGHGDGTFSSQTIYSTGNSFGPTAIAVGDFNNDGRLDITTANPGTWNISVLLGYGNGTFASQTTYSTGVYSFPLTLAVGDFNNDTNLDIAVGSSEHLEESVFILLGNGNGNFSSSGKYVTGIGSQPSSVVVGHFNNDNRLDIAVADRGTNNIGIFLGYGNGTFSTQTTYSTNDGSNSTSLAAGDFNGDNLTDIAVANYGTFTVGVFLALSDTSFEEKTTLFTGSAAHPRAIAIGDFTNDGQLDVAVANYGTHNIGILRIYENGSFLMQTAYSGDLTFYPVSIVAADFNNDSRLDIVVSNPVADNVNVLFGEGNGTFGNDTAYSTGVGSNPQSVAIGDFNNDHQTDIVIAHFGTGSVGVLLKADSAALKSPRSFSTGSASKPHGVAVGDFDNDGRLDIVVANNGNANIGFFCGFGNGTFSSQSITSLGEDIYPIWVGVGDFNNDKRLDVVVADNQWPAPIIVLLGNGNGSFRIKTTDGVSPAWSGAIGDFNSDGRLDLAISQANDNSVTVLLGYGDGTFGNQRIYSIGSGSNLQLIAVDDFNNDSRLDIAVAYCDMNNVGVLLGYGNGTFASQTTYTPGVGFCLTSVAVGDFNNDSQLDIAVANFDTNNVGVFLGYGNGTFASQTTYSTGDGSAPRWLAVGDFNNDGRLDIAVTHFGNHHVGILLGYVNGTFFDEVTYFTGDNSQPLSVAIGDFNNDGRLDITVSAMGRESIDVFLGYASENFISTPTYPIGSSSQPVSIAVGDFNNDTRLDVAVADRGTNEIIILHGSGYGTFSSQANYSTGDGSYPSWVAVGDFNQDHQLDIVVVNSGSNNIGVLLGYGNGTFSSSTTYSTGDFSSPLSLAVGYFDNDTHLDIAVAIYGTNNVGLFLGYGNGSFASPLLFSSGFGSHPSAVAFGDLNNDNSVDIVVCNNGSSTIEILSKICKSSLK